MASSVDPVPQAKTLRLRCWSVWINASSLQGSSVCVGGCFVCKGHAHIRLIVSFHFGWSPLVSKGSQQIAIRGGMQGGVVNPLRPHRCSDRYPCSNLDALGLEGGRVVMMGWWYVFCCGLCLNIQRVEVNHEKKKSKAHSSTTCC